MAVPSSVAGDSGLSIKMTLPVHFASEMASQSTRTRVCQSQTCRIPSGGAGGRGEVCEDLWGSFPRALCRREKGGCSLPCVPPRLDRG